jgi:simple sugar transport system substrate-binding protein/D-xylose transport system substrate-binding protein
VVTRDNIAKVLKEPGFAVKIADVCTAEYKAACTDLGLS